MILRAIIGRGAKRGHEKWRRLLMSEPPPTPHSSPAKGVYYGPSGMPELFRDRVAKWKLFATNTHDLGEKPRGWGPRIRENSLMTIRRTDRFRGVVCKGGFHEILRNIKCVRS